MGEAAGHSPAESERILLLECRLEKVCSALADARADGDRLRNRLAEAAAWEADHARRYSLVHQELAESRAEIASLHERLNSSEALRAELEGHLFEAGSGSDAAELVQLRQEVLTQRQRSRANAQAATRLRARVDELVNSRETLFTRMAEWHWLLQKGDPGAVDLGEFISELRRDIMVLENRNAAGDRQEVALRELLARAGVDPDDSSEEDSAAVTPAEFAVLETSRAPNIELNGGQSGNRAIGQTTLTDREPEVATFEGLLSIAPKVPIEQPAVAAPAAAVPAAAAPVSGLRAADPAVRAASYGGLTRVLEDSPTQLADQLRSGLSDADPRVRRRAVLAAATARNLALRPLLDPLREDPDPHVRRVVREVLRNAPDAET